MFVECELSALKIYILVLIAALLAMLSLLISKAPKENLVMSIKMPLLHNSIISRSFAFYRSMLTIIKFSDVEISLQNHAVDRLSEVHQEFLEGYKIDVEELQIYLSKFFAIVHSMFKESGTDMPYNLIKKYNAEQDAIIAWCFRNVEPIAPMLTVRDDAEVENPSFQGNFVQSIEHMKISSFTKELTDEWLKILNEDERGRPIWFNELPVWQKRIYIDLVSLWQNRDEVVRNYNTKKPEEFDRMSLDTQLRIMSAFQNRLRMKSLSDMNLGEIFGLNSGAHVKNPAIRMGYSTNISTYLSTKPKSLNLVRRAHFCRIAIPSVIMSDKKEQFRISKANIEQAILHELPFNFGRLSKLYPKDNLVVPVFFQYSPSHHNFLPEELLLKIVRKVISDNDKYWKDSKYCKKLISDNEIS